MKSTEKLAALVDDYLRREPETMQEAGMQLAARQLAPNLLGQLPSDPDVLDQLLEAASQWALSLRSDVEVPNQEIPA